MIPIPYLTSTHDVLTAGLDWLYHTVQPDTALVEHFGARLRTTGRTLRFLPIASAGNPLIVIEADVHRGFGRPCAPTSLLSEAEILDLAARLEERNVPAAAHHNHGLTATIALARLAHDSLRAAVARFTAGCPYHHSQVCEAPVSAGGASCPWHSQGHSAAIWPAHPHRDAVGL